MSRDTPPKEEEMEGMAEHFNQLEAQKDLEPNIIRTTKIHKVLRAIVKLPTIPREAEFDFKKRSSDLLNSWSSALSTENEGSASASTEKSPKTNGDAKHAEIPTKAEEPAEKPSPKEDAAQEGNSATEGADVTMTDIKDDKPTDTAAESSPEAKEEAQTEAATATAPEEA